MVVCGEVGGGGVQLIFLTTLSALFERNLKLLNAERELMRSQPSVCVLGPFVNIWSSESIFAKHGNNIMPLETTLNS